MMGVIENYNRILKEIEERAAASGRNSGDIHIIAVSKTFSVDAIQAAIDCGIRLFGENKVQEAKRKIPELKGEYIFHMVGHLQSNKARDAVRFFDMIHSIDSVSTAEKVDQEAARIGKKQKVLIQVNTSGEETKSGVPAGSALELAVAMRGMKNLDLKGLMTMAPFTDDRELIRGTFRSARKLLDDINRAMNTELIELSMGMSSDFRIAVEEGATMVRIGTALFGERDAG